MGVVDHDTRRLVWAAPGRSSATVGEFFDLLGEQRCSQITTGGLYLIGESSWRAAIGL